MTLSYAVIRYLLITLHTQNQVYRCRLSCNKDNKFSKVSRGVSVTKRVAKTFKLYQAFKIRRSQVISFYFLPVTWNSLKIRKVAFYNYVTSRNEMKQNEHNQKLTKWTKIRQQFLVNLRAHIFICSSFITTFNLNDYILMFVLNNHLCNPSVRYEAMIIKEGLL